MIDVIETQIDEIYGGWVPRNLINQELPKTYGNHLLAEYTQIMKYYAAYNEGAEFSIITGKNYEPPHLAYRKIKALIDKEARFLFSKSPDFIVKSILDDNVAENLAAMSVIQKLVDQVLQENSVKNNLTQAARDCFIGKRIAIMTNFNSEGIQISMLPSLNFLYENDRYGRLSKFVGYFLLNDAANNIDKRIYCKKYWIDDDGYCYVEEKEYDGSGNLLNTYIPATRTMFTQIPVTIVINGGLLEDYGGVSDVAELLAYESMYSELSNNDIDSELHSMNPIRYTIDMSPDSTKDLSVAAGAYWDLNTDQAQLSGGKGAIGLLESKMSYSPALTTTLDRVDDLMYNQLEIPNTTPSKLQGIITSGKTLKALYWGMVVRCDEKMNAWRSSLEDVMRFIIEGAKLYPESAKKYIQQRVPSNPYEVRVDNQYPLPEDEAEEKTIDMAEVSTYVMSHKSYLKKWHGMTDLEAEEELAQIAREKRLFEESYFSESSNVDDDDDIKLSIRDQGDKKIDDRDKPAMR